MKEMTIWTRSIRYLSLMIFLMMFLVTTHNKSHSALTLIGELLATPFHFRVASSKVSNKEIVDSLDCLIFLNKRFNTSVNLHQNCGT